MEDSIFIQFPTTTEIISDFYCIYEKGTSSFPHNEWLSSSSSSGRYRLQDVRKSCHVHLSNLEHADWNVATCAADHLLFFMEGNVTVSSKNTPSFFITLRGNTRTLFSWGSWCPSVSYLSRCIDRCTTKSTPLHADDMVALHRGITLVYLQISVHLHELHLAQTLSRSYAILPRLLLLLEHFHDILGFPTKRILLLNQVYIMCLLSTDAIVHNVFSRNRASIDFKTQPMCPKSTKRDIEKAQDISKNRQDAFRGFKKKVNAERISVLQAHLHIPFAHRSANELEVQRDENTWNVCDVQQHITLLSSIWNESFTILLKTIVEVSSSSLNSCDKGVFFTTCHDGGESVRSKESPYWDWLKREKLIALRASLELILLLLKRFRLQKNSLEAHVMAQTLVQHDLLPIMIKFLNKDIARYLSAPYAPEGETLITFYQGTLLSPDSDGTQGFSILRTRVVTLLLRLLQRFCKTRPSLVKYQLVRLNSLLFLQVILNNTIFFWYFTQF